MYDRISGNLFAALARLFQLAVAGIVDRLAAALNHVLGRYITH